jgi:DNA-binding CsgD family transcriptional regulator
MAEEILTTLQNELTHHNDRVDKCQAALEEAVAKRDAFVEKIASTLGLARKPGQTKETVAARQAKVLALYKAGKSPGLIAADLEIKTKTVHNDLRALQNNHEIPDPVRQHDNTPSRPPTVTEDGESDAEETTDAEETEEEAADDSSSESAPSKRSSSERSATKGQLVAEVDRQQQGVKSKVVTLNTSTAKKHKHQAKVDRMGDGQTTVDSTGHVHRVFRFVLSAAQGHTHDLVV